jgi:hypothetical protein
MKTLEEFDFGAKTESSSDACDTNLAAEFYVLYALHRLGMNATLTLGNKKRVDIVIALDAGKAITVDVKGLRGRTSWPIDNVKKGKKDHFIIFVSFLNESDPSVPPEVYIVPSLEIPERPIEHPAIYENKRKTRRVVPLGRAREVWKKYKDNWKLLREVFEAESPDS